MTGPALHPTQIRAYALLAASNMLAGSVGFHPHPAALADWEARVRETAERFAAHIAAGGSEVPDGHDS